jgi:CBS domain-containing protein
VLTPAVALAALMQASIDLLRVVDPPLNLNPVGEGHGTVLFSHTLYEEEAALRQRAQAEAERYLKEVAQRLRAQDLRVETRVAADLSPAAAILGDAADHGIDVIAMAPHGRGALARLFIGSVADKVVRAATVPVLVIRSPDSRVSPSAKESSMNAPSSAAGSSRLVLAADTAADLMAPNPISISAKSSVKEASLLLTEKGFSAAPVIDDAGRPVGVISKTDIVVHAREKADYLAQAPEYYQKSDLTTAAGEPLGGGFQVESVDATLVRDIMTPAVFSVVPETPAGGVVQQILELKVHRLFVVDRAGVLVGVISALDILRCLR